MEMMAKPAGLMGASSAPTAVREMSPHEKLEHCSERVKAIIAHKSQVAARHSEIRENWERIAMEMVELEKAMDQIDSELIESIKELDQITKLNH